MAVVYESQGVSGLSEVTSIVIVKPTGLALDDLMVSCVSSDNNSSATTITAPAGWTTLKKSNFSGGNEIAELAIFHKIADSSDVSASNFTFTTSGGTSMVSYGVISRISGYDSGNIFSTPAEAIANFATIDLTATQTFGSSDDLYFQVSASGNMESTGSTLTATLDNVNVTNTNRFADGTFNGVDLSMATFTGAWNGSGSSGVGTTFGRASTIAQFGAINFIINATAGVSADNALSMCNF